MFSFLVARPRAPRTAPPGRMLLVVISSIISIAAAPPITVTQQVPAPGLFISMGVSGNIENRKKKLNGAWGPCYVSYTLFFSVIVRNSGSTGNLKQPQRSRAIVLMSGFWRQYVG